MRVSTPIFIINLRKSVGAREESWWCRLWSWRKNSWMSLTSSWRRLGSVSPTQAAAAASAVAAFSALWKMTKNDLNEWVSDYHFVPKNNFCWDKKKKKKKRGNWYSIGRKKSEHHFLPVNDSTQTLRIKICTNFRCDVVSSSVQYLTIACRRQYY